MNEYDEEEGLPFEKAGHVISLYTKDRDDPVQQSLWSSIELYGETFEPMRTDVRQTMVATLASLPNVQTQIRWIEYMYNKFPDDELLHKALAGMLEHQCELTLDFDCE